MARVYLRIRNGVNVLSFGKLEEVIVRKLWRHEQYDFSSWLAQKENMEYLGDILGLTLTDIDQEVFVGSYRCDLVAKDETTGIKVIIENQLEASDHDHLGKIITYASGLNANVIVWIVTQAREEHRSAIEWLNNNTGNDLSFFLIELHAYKIGDSLPAPKFEIIEKPNGFIKYSKAASGAKEVSRAQTEREAERLTFWTMFNDVIAENGKPFNIRKATTDYWYDVALGRSDAYISIYLVNKASRIDIQVCIFDNKDLYDALFARKEEIEAEMGIELDWRRLDGKKASRIMQSIPGLNFENHSNYPELMNEIIKRVIHMRKVFKKYI